MAGFVERSGQDSVIEDEKGQGWLCKGTVLYDRLEYI
ncbi:uncharacterized protein G2W53_019632 [Senna tora]|uniref:Uncharacterized protein n=1 Tax=Senna tora TaxID=362788 RepID=A0A834WPD1_9FABA|nr:uncharacterized protein G2W53_019632 [Senna tora]